MLVVGSSGGQVLFQDVLEGNDIVARLDGSYTFTDRFDDTGTLVSEDDGESTFWVLAGECVGVLTIEIRLCSSCEWHYRLTCVAYTSVVNLDANFVGLWRADFDVLDNQVFTSFPGDGGLAGNRLIG